MTRLGINAVILQRLTGVPESNLVVRLVYPVRRLRRRPNHRGRRIEPRVDGLSGKIVLHNGRHHRRRRLEAGPELHHESKRLRGTKAIYRNGFYLPARDLRCGSARNSFPMAS